MVQYYEISDNPLIKAIITLWTEEFYKYLQTLGKILNDIINITN